MKKLRIVGLKSDEAYITDVLAKSGNFEVTSCGKEGVVDVDSLLVKKARCAFAVESYDGAVNTALLLNKKGSTFEVKKPSSARFFSCMAEIDKTGTKADDVLAVCDEIEALNHRRIEIKTAISKITAQIRQLAPYAPCTDKLSLFTQTETTFSVLAVGKSNVGLLDKLAEKAVIVNYATEKSKCVIGTVAKLTDKEEVLALLAEGGFVPCSVFCDQTPSEVLCGYDDKISALNAEDGEIIRQILSYESKMTDIKKLHDYYMIEAEKAVSENSFAHTVSTFVAEGWSPEPAVQDLLDTLSSRAVVVLIDDVSPTDNPPTLYKDNKILAPYQSLTDGYSAPSYFEPDPAPFTAFFFFLFFGIMTADMGYGILLTVGALLAVKFMKPEKGMRNLMLLIGYSSISAIIWGILFGSVFGVSFGGEKGIFGVGFPDKVWFNPMDEPIRLMLLSLILGTVHITCGYAIDFYKHFKAKEYTDAFFDDGFLIVTYIGTFLLVLWLGNPIDGLFSVDAYPEAFSSLLMPGLIVMGVGLLGTVLTKGRKEKTVISKIITGLSGLYGVVSILSDVLSYSRIFGLTIASCAIAFAFNIIVEMVAGLGFVGLLASIVLAALLHLFNMAMGVLSAYVHNARLQYLEFYGKFYTGEGRLFKPLGQTTKFVRFV